MSINYSFCIVTLFAVIGLQPHYTQAAQNKAAKQIEQCLCKECQNCWFPPKQHPYTDKEKALACLWQALPHASGVKNQLPLCVKLVLEYAYNPELKYEPETWLAMKSLEGDFYDASQPVLLKRKFIDSVFGWNYSKEILINDSVRFVTREFEKLRYALNDDEHDITCDIKSIGNKFRVKAKRNKFGLVIQRYTRLDHNVRSAMLLQEQRALEQQQPSSCVIS